MPLAYYSVAAEQEFWNDHWGAHSVDEMLAVARRSPLTALLVEALAAAPGRRVLEAGCGLGQYVVLLRESGWNVVGVDWSSKALAACRRVASVPLAHMDLGALALRDRSVDACLSLGVVEHDVSGPDALLAETARILVPGGLLLVSVPYLNGVRSLWAPWIASRGRALARRGGGFYQYAFTRAEFCAALDRQGFDVQRTTPYDPARIIRRLVPTRVRARLRGAGAGMEAPSGREGREGERVRAESGWSTTRAGALPSAVSPTVDIRATVKRLLYTRGSLALFGHMLLAVAIKR